VRTAVLNTPRQKAVRGASKIDFSKHPEQLLLLLRTGSEIQLRWLRVARDTIEALHLRAGGSETDDSALLPLACNPNAIPKPAELMVSWPEHTAADSLDRPLGATRFWPFSCALHRSMERRRARMMGLRTMGSRGWIYLRLSCFGSFRHDDEGRGRARRRSVGTRRFRPRVRLGRKI
jgi:hypothetical protein